MTTTIERVGYKQPDIAWNGRASNTTSTLERGRIETAPKEFTTTPRGLTLNQGLVDWRATVNGTRTCSVDGCQRAPRSSNQPLCETHYYRVRRNGTIGLKPRDAYKIPEPRARRVSVRPCEITDCDRRAVSLVGELRTCLMHYKRWKRHGDVNVTPRAWSPPNPIKSLCGVDGCETLEDGACGYCKLHLARLRRHGDPTVFIAPEDRDAPRGDDNHRWTGDAATYRAMHQRVRARRGSASAFDCVDCEKPANHWSYSRRDPDERTSDAGPYSVDIAHYEPRCVRCHKRFDLAAIRARAA